MSLESLKRIIPLKVETSSEKLVWMNIEKIQKLEGMFINLKWFRYGMITIILKDIIGLWQSI